MKEKIQALMLEWFRENDPDCVTESNDFIVREDRDAFSLNKLATFIAEGLQRDV